MRFSFVLAVCVLATRTGMPVTAQSPGLSPSITSDMLFDGQEIRPSSTPDDPRIYFQGPNGKVNRLKQPHGYPKFPKSDRLLADHEEAQYHHGRDFPTPRPTSFMAGVHGTVIFAGPPDAKEKRVLVLMPTGEVMHYLHASEIAVKFGDEITPHTVLGKTSDHLHLQATDKDNRLIDVDRSFLAGRSPILGSTIKAFVPRWVDVGPSYVGNKKPVVRDGVLMVEESKRLYYDDDAPKVSKEEQQFLGTWQKGSGEYTFRQGGKGDWKSADGKKFDLSWQYVGMATFNRIPTETGGKDGTWQGPKMRWWFGANPGANNDYVLGLYRLGERELLVPDKFYDGRDWYTKKK